MLGPLLVILPQSNLQIRSTKDSCRTEGPLCRGSRAPQHFQTIAGNFHNSPFSNNIFGSRTNPRSRNRPWPDRHRAGDKNWPHNCQGGTSPTEFKFFGCLPLLQGCGSSISNSTCSSSQSSSYSTPPKNELGKKVGTFSHP